MSLLSDLVVWTVRGYQRMISYYTPPACRFHPTCSQYAVGAIRVYGPARGMAMASWRIFRCNPFHPGGHDPVPPVDSGVKVG
jgi:hypothetical protein